MLAMLREMSSPDFDNDRDGVTPPAKRKKQTIESDARNAPIVIVQGPRLVFPNRKSWDNYIEQDAESVECSPFETDKEPDAEDHDLDVQPLKMKQTPTSFSEIRFDRQQSTRKFGKCWPSCEMDTHL